MDFSPLSFSDLTQCSNITHKGISEVKCRFCKVPFHCGSVAQWGSNQPAALSCSSPTEQFVFAKAPSRSPADFRHKTNFFRLWGCIFISLRLLQRHNTFNKKNPLNHWTPHFSLDSINYHLGGGEFWQNSHRVQALHKWVLCSFNDLRMTQKEILQGLELEK